MDIKDKLISQFQFSDFDFEITQQMFEHEAIEAKCFFVEEGKIATKLGIVESGMFRTFYFNNDNEEITTAFQEPGSLLLSIDSFNNQTRSNESIVAVENSQLYTISLEKWQKLNEQVPKWRDVCRISGDYISMMLQARAREFQTLTAKERYSKFCDKHPAVLQKATLGQIASFLGIDIATLSRIRNKI